MLRDEIVEGVHEEQFIFMLCMRHFILYWNCITRTKSVVLMVKHSSRDLGLFPMRKPTSRFPF